MTHNIQKSFFKSGRIYNKRYYPGNFYQVVINTEDGEEYKYEVKADTFGDAATQAEQLADSLMADITIVEVYQLG